MTPSFPQHILSKPHWASSLCRRSHIAWTVSRYPGQVSAISRFGCAPTGKVCSWGCIAAYANTQDATSANGEVPVELELKGANCTIRNIDTRQGAWTSYSSVSGVSSRLTARKGPRAWDIAAYQIGETVRAIGGAARVQSEVVKATRLVLELRRASLHGGMQDETCANYVQRGVEIAGPRTSNSRPTT